MILSDEPFVPSIYSIARGDGRSMGLAEIEPSSPAMTIRLAVQARAHAQAERYRHRQAQAFISENKTNCKARRGK